MDPHPESEVLLEGPMVKSPPRESPPLDNKPTGYSLFNKLQKWRRRWFVLQQGKLPRQYVLNYYTDETKKRLKGTIPLDDCQQVEHGLVDKNRHFDFMFSINTSSRVYYLAVDTQQEMDTWVNMVCKACGLRDTSEEDLDSATTSEVVASSTNTSTLVTSRGQPGIPQAAMRSLPAQKPVYENTANLSTIPHLTQPKPSISSPYIHISECYSGKGPPKPPPRFRSSESTGSNRHDSSTDDEPIYYYMPPVVNTTDRNGKTDKLIMIPDREFLQEKVPYIDLDLPAKGDDDVFIAPAVPKVPAMSNESSTIYKEVDFERTKAFNQTRKDREEKRHLDKSATIDHRH